MKDLGWIDGQKESMQTLLAKWVNINSGSTNVPGLHAMTCALVEAFAPLGAKAEEIAMKPMKAVDSRGEVIAIPLGKALRFRKRAEAPIQVFLGGHMDTVFPKSSPFQKAEFLDEHIMRGPGAADMKGGLVVLLTALSMLERTSWRSAIGWEVFINPDEELGSPSSAAYLAECAARHHAGLIFEPAYVDGSVVNVRKGSFNFTVIAKGRQAHAGRDFHEGINAIGALARCLVAVEALNDQKRGITINLGTITGGSAANIVADAAICQCNARMDNAGDLEELKKALDKIVEKVNNAEKAALSLWLGPVRPPKLYDKKNELLFLCIQDCARELGFLVGFKSSGGVCDGNILSAHGLPVIDTLGPSGEFLHTCEERVYLDTLVPRAKLCGLFLLKLAAREIGPFFCSTREEYRNEQLD